jgi:hypothetical protein
MTVERTAAPPVVDRLLGALGVVMLVAGLFFSVRALVAREAATSAPPPPLTLVSPADGEHLQRPVAIVFRAAAPLRQTSMGWGTGGRHLHLQIDDLSVMPGPDEIRPLPGGEYRWTVPALGSGEHVLRLAWSDADHQLIPEGGSTAARVTVE